MNGFYLLTGHLLGDFILQNDWLANNKTKSHTACFIHCMIYAFCLWAFTWHFLPWWCIALAFAFHYPVDRYRLARKAMKWTGSDNFASPPFTPWSIFVVDLAIHFVTLCWISLLAGQEGPDLSKSYNLYGSILFCVILLLCFLILTSLPSYDRHEDNPVSVPRIMQAAATQKAIDELFAGLPKHNTAILPKPVGPQDVGVGGTVVHSNRGFVLDFPQGFVAANGHRRTFLPVVPTDTCSALGNRLDAIMVQYTDRTDVKQVMQQRMRDRYTLWKQQGDNILDVTLETHAVVVPEKGESDEAEDAG